MMMFPAILVVRVAVAAVGTAFGLEGGLHVDEIRSEATEHVLDDMVRSYAKDPIPDFSRQMPISQMPRKAHELIGVRMPDLDHGFGRGSNREPSPIFELQAISISHRNRCRKVEKDMFAKIRSQADATAMSRVKIEGERARRLFLRPTSGASMNGSDLRHVNT
jgi:hypothetical protein